VPPPATSRSPQRHVLPTMTRTTLNTPSRRWRQPPLPEPAAASAADFVPARGADRPRPYDPVAAASVTAAGIDPEATIEVGLIARRWFRTRVHAARGWTSSSSIPQDLENFATEHADVAGSQGHHEIPERRPIGQDAGHGGPRRLENDVLRCQRHVRRQGLPASTGNGLFTWCEYFEHDRHVGFTQRSPEF